MRSKDIFPVIIISLIGTTGISFTGILPFLVGGIVDNLGFEREMVGWISFVNIIGLALGGLLATVLIGRISLLRMVQISLIGMIFFDVLSIYVHAEITMLSIRFLSGIAGGVSYALALAAFSSFEQPIKAFGVYIIVYCLWSIGALLLMPYILEAWGLMGGFGFSVVMGIFCLGAAQWVFPKQGHVSQKGFPSLSSLLSNKFVIYALLSYFALQLGGGTIWAYVERIAKDVGMSPKMIGFALGISGVPPLFAGSLILRWGDKLPPKPSLIIGTFCMILGSVGLFWANIYAVLLGTLLIFGGAWAFVMPFFQQMQARFDSQGKVVSIGSLLNMAGRAAGPGLAALFLGDAAFVQVVWIAVAAFVISMLIVLMIPGKAT